MFEYCYTLNPVFAIDHYNRNSYAWHYNIHNVNRPLK